MEVVDAVNITFYGVVFVTLFWLLPFWLLAVRPRYRRERTGSRGSARPTERSVRVSAGIMALVASSTGMLTGFFGYQWYFGLVAYGFLWIGIMYSADASLFPKSFAGPMRITALGAALLSAALVLGWVDYCGWALSPLLRFRALCGLSMVAFLYVALLHIREG